MPETDEHVQKLDQLRLHADRKFYNLSQGEDHRPLKVQNDTTFQDLFQYVYKNVIGNHTTFAASFGQREVVYCDYVASGKPLHFIEKFILEEVQPMYGNTHTTTSVTSLQTTLHRHEAKDIIRNAVNASEHDAVLFCGSGATGAIHKLISALNFKESPVVFLGPFEHHSNFLPWKEIGAKIIRILETPDGSVDLHHLVQELKNHQNCGKPLIGTFSAASNVTGVLTDDIVITALLHKYGALAFWDYACAGPYVRIDMNPVATGSNQGLVYKDAIFISPHKFVGGPDTPGLLVAKKKLFVNPVPAECGGGTVFFVSRENHRYLQEVEMREEGGTPCIVGAIRAGLVFQLKEALTSEAIMSRERQLCQLAFEHWSPLKDLTILGPSDQPRLPIFSFVIHHPLSGLLLHYNFVCALLNDLFGIQARGGCACAGPYAQDLLGIDEKMAQHIEDLLAEDRTIDRVHLRRYREYSEREILRPGFARLNIPFCMSDDDVNFVLEAISLIVKNGWKLLPLYMFCPETGEWKHHSHQHYKDRKWLGSISYNSGGFQFAQPRHYSSGPLPANRTECLEFAKEVFTSSVKSAHRIPLPDQSIMFDTESEKLRWFLLPSEAKAYLFGEKTEPIKELPFHPVKYPLESHPIQDKLLNTNCTNGKCNSSVEASNGVQNENKVCPIRRPLVTTSSCSKWVSPPKVIFKPFLKAVTDFSMLKNGDRVLVCLSGGKDSLSLLHTIRQYQIYSKNQEVPVLFDLGAVTVDPQSSAYDPSPLKGYLASLTVPYFYEEQCIIDMATQVDECKSICSFCSRMKRGRIYACARREGYNVLAFGQHLDDLAESFFMSIFHNGRLRTMKANYAVHEGDLRVIRPFAYVREKNLRKFAEDSKLPVIPENCPGCFEAPKERHRTKQLLAQQEVLFPKLFSSLQSSLLPLMAINKTGMENGGLFWMEQQRAESDDEQ